jgi:DNA modification methylase
MAEKVVIGNAELWHGDCREVLPLLPWHDLLLTDPPYGIGRDGEPYCHAGLERIWRKVQSEIAPPLGRDRWM